MHVILKKKFFFLNTLMQSRIKIDDLICNIFLNHKIKFDKHKM